jgi:hypothetical protein
LSLVNFVTNELWTINFVTVPVPPPPGRNILRSKNFAKTNGKMKWWIRSLFRWNFLVQCCQNRTVFWHDFAEMKWIKRFSSTNLWWICRRFKRNKLHRWASIKDYISPFCTRNIQCWAFHFNIRSFWYRLNFDLGYWLTNPI